MLPHLSRMEFLALVNWKVHFRFKGHCALFFMHALHMPKTSLFTFFLMLKITSGIKQLEQVQLKI